VTPGEPGAAHLTGQAAGPSEVELPVSGAARRVTWIWVSSAIVFLIAAAGTFIAALAYDHGPISATIVRAALPEQPLRLRVENLNGRLQVSWNLDSPAVRTATSGVLHIQDEKQVSDLPLDARQVANGSVEYQPVSREVFFRLDLESTSGPAEATLQVIDEVPPVPAQKKVTTDEFAAYDETAKRSSSPKPDKATAYDDPRGPNAPPSGTTLQYIPPRPLQEVWPDPKTIWPGLVTSAIQVAVQVDVDAMGRVTAAKIVNGGQRVPPPLAASALSAAKQWMFEPARRGNQMIEGQHTIMFHFQPGG